MTTDVMMIPGLDGGGSKRGRGDEMRDRIDELFHHTENNVALRVFQDIAAHNAGRTSLSCSSSSCSPADEVESFFASRSSSSSAQNKNLEATVKQYQTRCAEVEQKLKRARKDCEKADEVARQKLDVRREFEQEVFRLKTALAQRDLLIKQLQEDKGELAAIIERYEQDRIQFAKRAREDREEAVRAALALERAKNGNNI